MPEADRKISAVYTSWGTFTNALDQLAQGVPQRIDRSVFPGLAWTIQNQLITGLKFLGLIDDNGVPSEKLEMLASRDESSRRKVMRDIVQDRYASLIAIDLKKATPLLLRQTMSELYGVTGDTLKRAVRFFIAAAEYVGLEMSPLLNGKRADGNTPKRRRTVRVKAGTKKQAAEQHVDDDPYVRSNGSKGTSRTIQLRTGGGTLTLSASLDIFALGASDRRFVFNLIDELDKYEKQEPVAAPAPSSGAGSE